MSCRVVSGRMPFQCLKMFFIPNAKVGRFLHITKCLRKKERESNRKKIKIKAEEKVIKINRRQKKINKMNEKIIIKKEKNRKKRKRKKIYKTMQRFSGGNVKRS